MLKSFNYPLTPKGKLTLTPPPPWYYSADFLNIEFWCESKGKNRSLFWSYV
jgi:acetoacetate decarboxylase